MNINEFVAKWWADLLRGDDTLQSENAKLDGAQGAMIDMFSSTFKKDNTPENIDAFEKSLLFKLESTGYLLKPYVDMYTDYNPPTIVAEAANEAGLSTFGNFPFKTGIIIRDGKVEAKQGYGNGYVQIYPPIE